MCECFKEALKIERSHKMQGMKPAVLCVIIFTEFL